MTTLLAWFQAHTFGIVFGLLFLVASYLVSRMVGFIFNRPAGLLVGVGILFFCLGVIPVSVFLVSTAAHYHTAAISQKPPTINAIPHKKQIIRKKRCGYF